MCKNSRAILLCSFSHFKVRFTFLNVFQCKQLVVVPKKLLHIIYKELKIWRRIGTKKKFFNEKLLNHSHVSEVLFAPVLPRLLRDAVDRECDDVVDENDATEDPEHDVDQRHLAEIIGINLKQKSFQIEAFFLIL